MPQLCYLSGATHVSFDVIVYSSVQVLHESDVIVRRVGCQIKSHDQSSTTLSLSLRWWQRERSCKPSSAHAAAAESVIIRVSCWDSQRARNWINACNSSSESI
jgi:hypothetical protein